MGYFGYQMVKLILQNFLNMLMKVVIEKVTVTGMRSVQVQSESPGENLFHWMIQQKAACRHIRTTSNFFFICSVQGMDQQSSSLLW